MSIRDIERRGYNDEIGFEQSHDAKDYLRISKLIRRAEEDDNCGIDQRALFEAARQRSQKMSRDERNQQRSGSHEYEYEVNYDDSSNSASPIPQQSKFNTSQVRHRPKFRPLNKENANLNMRSAERQKSSERLHSRDDMPLMANLSHKEVKYTPAAHPPKSRRVKKKDQPKQSFQMQLMMEKLTQLKEIEKQSKSLKSSALMKGLKSARKYRINDNQPKEKTLNASQKLQVTTRHNSNLGKQLKHAKSGLTLESTTSKRTKSKSKLDKTLNDYLKHSTSQIVRESEMMAHTRSAKNLNYSRSRSAARMHPRLCEIQEINAIEGSKNASRERQSGRSRNNEHLQTFRSSKSGKSSKSKASLRSTGKNNLDRTIQHQRNGPDLQDFQSNTCIEMFANQYLNRGKMSFGGESQINTASQVNTAQCSKEITRNVTPEQFKHIREEQEAVTSQSKCISQYKSNQKDCKIPLDYQVHQAHIQYLEKNVIDTSRTMDLEELDLQNKKDSAHHQSAQSIQEESEAIATLTQRQIEVEIVQEAKQDLAAFFEIEFKNCQRELLQTKTQLYESRYKVDSLKKRLEEAQQAASDQMSQNQQLRAKLSESRLNETGRHSHRVDSLQMDSSNFGHEIRHREEIETLKNQFSRLSTEAQIEAQKFERMFSQIQDEQVSDLRQQRLFVKSIVQQISQVENYIGHVNKLIVSQPTSVIASQRSKVGRDLANSTEQEEEPTVSLMRETRTLSAFIGLTTAATKFEQTTRSPQEDPLESYREKSARLACMFNSIYKTLKNLNDELIVKKKTIQQRRKQFKAENCKKTFELQEAVDQSQISVDTAFGGGHKIKRGGFFTTGAENETQETPRDSSRNLQRLSREHSRSRSSFAILQSRNEEIPQRIRKDPQEESDYVPQIRLNKQTTHRQSIDEVMTPALGNMLLQTTQSQSENYGAILKRNHTLKDTQQSTASENDRSCNNNEQYLLQMVTKLQTDLEHVKSQSTQLIMVNNQLQQQNQILQVEKPKTDPQLTRLKEENGQLSELVNGLKQQQRSQDIMIQYLQGTQNSILQKLQHQVIKNQFSTSLAESAAIARSFFQQEPDPLLEAHHANQKRQQESKDQSTSQGFGTNSISMDLLDYAERKNNKKNKNGLNQNSSQVETDSNEDAMGQGILLLSESEPKSEQKREVKATRHHQYVDSHQNARRQYFEEEGKHGTQSQNNNSASSLRSNNTKTNDISVISMNNLNSHLLMPDQMRQLMKRTESQGISDDGQDKPNPYMLTGQFQNKGEGLIFKNLGSDVDDYDFKQQEVPSHFHENAGLVSPVVRNLEALELMNDYNSNQIMMLVNQMKSASITHSGNRTKSERGLTTDRDTYDEEAITAMLRNTGQAATSIFNMQGDDNYKYVSKIDKSDLQTSSDRFQSRLLRSNRQDSMSQSDIQELTPSDNAFTNSMAARDIQLHEIRKKIQGLGHKQSLEVTDFEVYGMQQSKLGSNRVLSISDQQLMNNLLETDGTDQNENSQLFQAQTITLQNNKNQQLLQIKSPQFNQVGQFIDSDMIRDTTPNQDAYENQEHEVSQEVSVSAKVYADFQTEMQPETSSRITTPAVVRMNHNIESLHRREDSQQTYSISHERRISAQAQYIRELEQLLQINGFHTSNEAIPHNISQTAHSIYSVQSDRLILGNSRQDSMPYVMIQKPMQTRADLVLIQNKNSSHQQLPMVQEMQQMHDYQDTNSMMTEHMLQSTDLVKRRKSNYSPFSTHQGVGTSQLVLRSRSNSPHDTSLAASSDRIEKRTKRMKKQIQSIDAEIQQMLHSQFKN